MRSAPTLRAWTYGYDLAGNLTSQTDGQGQTLWFGYDPLHRLTEQRLNNGSGTPLASYGYDTGVNGLSRQTFAASHSTTLNDTFDALNTHTWVLQDASLDAGAMKTAGVWTGVCCYSSIYRPTYGLSPTAPSQSVQLEFKLNGNNADLYAHFMLEASSTPYVRFGIIATGNRIFVQYTTDGVNWIYPPADLINAIEVGAWYVLRLKVLPFGKGSIEVWNRDQPAQRGNSLVDMPNGLTYRFHHWMGNGTSWIDNYTELTDVTSAWSYDARGRATQEDKNLGAIGSWTTRYTYDAMDRMVSTIHPTSEAVSTGYDAGGRPVSLTSLHAGNTTPLISGAGYNALGQPTVITAGNGLTTRYVYWGLDNFAPGYPNFAYGRLRQVCVTANPTCPLGSTTGTYLNLAYNYDHVGNVITLR
ncbi:MAG: hypothetical protein M1546_24205, partial [Chloroflexi bacterium]|nr:hypothetical protein [Chloroflexota bacterium]